MTYVIQPSFAAGEVSKEIQARVDIAKNQVALKKARNFLIKPQGGAHTRPGTYYVAPTKYQDKECRFIPFTFSNTQAYVLEFGDQYMRVIKDGGLVLENTTNVTGATKANPCVITSNSHGYNNGDWVYGASIGGMTELNGKMFKVANKTTNTYELQDVYGNNINSTNYTTYTSGGTFARVYEISTPYLEADLPLIKYSQRMDDMVLTHTEYQQRLLTRTGHASWTLTTITMEPALDAPTNPTLTAHIEAAPYYTVSGATKANPCVITTSAAHGWSNGDWVYIYDVSGMTQINELFFRITVLTTTTFSLQDWDNFTNIDSTSYGTFSGTAKVVRTDKPRNNRYKITAIAEETGEESLPTDYVEATNDVTTDGNYDHITWDPVTGAAKYKVYHARNAIYGYIGETESLSFTNNNIEIDFSQSPPGDRNPFDGTNYYPGCVVHHDQRRTFAGSNNAPQTVEGSQIGNYSNFNRSSPAVSSDAWSLTCDTNEANIVKHLVSMGELLVLTSAQVFLFKPGNNSDTITPTSFNIKAQSNIGSSDIRPVAIGDTVLYVASGNPTSSPDYGYKLYDLGYKFETDKYSGEDLTILSQHLFDKNKPIVDMVYAQRPYGILYCLRQDGYICCFTFLSVHDVKAWTVLETDGDYKQITAIPQGGEDTIYVQVDRTIDGSSRKYIEYFSSREFINSEDYVGLDCALTYDAWNTSAVTITATGGTNWTVDEDITLTASSSTFVSGNVGDVLFLRLFDEDGVISAVASFEITAYTSGTVVTANPRALVPAGLRAVATSYWGWATNEITGLDHLEGSDVKVFAHGTSLGDFTVEDGAISLEDYYVKAHVGVEYNCDLETLDITGKIENGNFLPLKANVSQVAINLMSTQGLYIGCDEDNLYPLIDDEGYAADGSPALVDGIRRTNIAPDWETAGRIYIRVTDYPASILGVVPDVELGN